MSDVWALDEMTPNELIAEIERLRAWNTQCLADNKMITDALTEQGMQNERLRAALRFYRIDEDMIARALAALSGKGESYERAQVRNQFATDDPLSGKGES